MKNERSYEEFKHDIWVRSRLEQDVFNICFNLAWEFGHSSGYSEVELYFFDFETDFQKTYEIGFSDGRSYET